MKDLAKLQERLAEMMQEADRREAVFRAPLEQAGLGRSRLRG